MVAIQYDLGTLFLCAFVSRSLGAYTFTFIIQEIEIEIELTANHLGTFVMKLCPNNNPNQEATQECFDRSVQLSFIFCLKFSTAPWRSDKF